MGAFGLAGALLLPMIAPHWTLLAALLLIWGGVVAGLYTVGLGHIGSRFHGTELAAANAAFIFFYALGTVAGPAVIGTAMDLGGTDGFAWALTGFFGCFVVFAVWRLIFHPTKA
jgi:MFS family permease